MPHFETQGTAVAPGNFGSLLQSLKVGNILSDFEENRNGVFLNVDIIMSLLTNISKKKINKGNVL